MPRTWAAGASVTGPGGHHLHWPWDQAVIGWEKPKWVDAAAVATACSNLVKNGGAGSDVARNYQDTYIIRTGTIYLSKQSSQLDLGHII